MCGVMSQPSAALDARVTLEVGYVEAGGVERRVPLAHLAGVAPEHCRLVRSSPSDRGQRDYPGLYWSASRPPTAPRSRRPSLSPGREYRGVPAPGSPGIAQ